MMTPLPDLLDLAIFRHVVDGGSLRAAARALDLSPAVVSRRLARLEAQLGITLLVRTTRRLYVTPQARTFHRHCIAILDEVQAAAASVAPGGAALRGRVRAAIPTATMTRPFLSRLHAALDEHPDLYVELHVSDLTPNLLVGGFDVAIIFGELADSSLLGRRVGAVRPTLAATPSYLEAAGHPGQPRDLGDHRCLRFRDDRRQSEWVLWDADGRAHPVAIAGNLSCDSSEGLAQALYAGLGIGVRPESEVSRGIAEATLARVLPEYHLAPLPVFAVYPSRDRQSHAVNAFIDLVRDALAD